MRFQISPMGSLASRNFLTILEGLLAAVMATGVLLAQNQAAGPAPQDLFSAVKSGDTSTLKQLIAHGADVNAKDSEGMTPLHLAAFRGDRAAAEMLLMAGANVESSDDVGMTPLHGAAFNGHKDVVLLLLAHGASANPQDKAGMTPLHYAAAGGHDEVARALLAAAANPTALSAQGRTPADLAARNGHPDLAAMLRAAHSPSPAQQPAANPSKEAKAPRLITNADLPHGGEGSAPAGSGQQAGSGAPRRGQATSGARQGQRGAQGNHDAEVNALYGELEKLAREKRDLEGQMPKLQQRCDGVKESLKQSESNIQAGPGIVASGTSVQSTRRAQVDVQAACGPLQQAQSRLQAITRRMAEIQEKINDLDAGSPAPQAAPRNSRPAAKTPAGGS